jgi:hypothetical protein
VEDRHYYRLGCDAGNNLECSLLARALDETNDKENEKQATQIRIRVCRADGEFLCNYAGRALAEDPSTREEGLDILHKLCEKNRNGNCWAILGFFSDGIASRERAELA